MEVTFKLRVPSIPNYILYETTEMNRRGESPKVHISELSKDILSSIADEWRRELFKTAGHNPEETITIKDLLLEIEKLKACLKAEETKKYQG